MYYVAAVLVWLVVTAYGWKLFIRPRMQPMKKGLRKV